MQKPLTLFGFCQHTSSTTQVHPTRHPSYQHPVAWTSSKKKKRREDEREEPRESRERRDKEKKHTHLRARVREGAACASLLTCIVQNVAFHQDILTASNTPPSRGKTAKKSRCEGGPLAVKLDFCSLTAILLATKLQSTRNQTAIIFL